MENSIKVVPHENDMYSLDAEDAIRQSLEESVAELLNELSSSDKALYNNVLSMTQKEESHNELNTFLLLTQTVFSKFCFNLDFEENAWNDIKNNFIRLLEKYSFLKQIVDFYTNNVQLDIINPAIKPEQISVVQSQIKNYFLDI